MSKIKKIPSRIWINKYNINFEYETKRGNRKSQERYIKQVDKDTAERDFWMWIETMKEKEPHRAMLNVNILSITYVGGKLIKFE